MSCPRPPVPTAIGRLCEKCDGKCPICDSYVRPATLVRVCDECNYGSYEGRCVICGGTGVSDAYYCKECTLQEKDVSVHAMDNKGECMECMHTCMNMRG
eukprot:scaffold140176_cov21-Tisochrysis_lutea.AAC.1